MAGRPSYDSKIGLYRVHGTYMYHRDKMEITGAGLLLDWYSKSVIKGRSSQI